MPRINVQGTTVEYLDQGSGDLAVLLHSSGASAAQWRALAETLAQHYRVIAPDLYGYGATPHWAGRGPFSLCHEAAIVHALLERLGAPAHLVGHSYGGAVALHVAAMAEHELLSLTLIEPVAFHLLRGGDAADGDALHEIMGVVDGVTRSLLCGDYAGGFCRFVDYWTGCGAWTALSPARRDALAPRLAKVALDFHATLTEPTRLDDARAIGVPALLIQGAATKEPTRRICHHLARTLPEARHHTIDGAGHMAPLTHGDAVNPLVAAHLATNATHLVRRSRWASCR